MSFDHTGRPTARRTEAVAVDIYIETRVVNNIRYIRRRMLRSADYKCVYYIIIIIIIIR